MVFKKIVSSEGEGEKPLTAKQRAERWLAKDEAGAASGATARADAYMMATMVIAADRNLAQGRKEGPARLKARSAESKLRMRELARQAFKNQHIVRDGKSIAFDLTARAQWVLDTITKEDLTKVTGEPYSLRSVKDTITGIGP